MSLYEKMTVEGVLLLDGEVGGGLRKMVPEQESTKLVPASILLEDPEKVFSLHLSYIKAGAQVITTNTYATVETRVEQLLGAGSRWAEMMTTACRMAVKAREASGKDVLIAGSLPPLNGSYRPDKVGAVEDLLPVYRRHVAIMAEHVDLFICETMSTALEAWAAASAAAESGKPVWVAWNLLDDGPRCSCNSVTCSKATAAGPRLRSGESLEEAWELIAELKPDAVLVNCVMPETIMAAIPYLAQMGTKIFGGYGNGFTCIPEGWTVQNGGIAALGKRRDLTPKLYADMALEWVDAGARVVGGCCEVGPDYIAEMQSRLAPELSGSQVGKACFELNEASVSSQASTECLTLNGYSTSSSAWSNNFLSQMSNLPKRRPPSLEDIAFHK
eukprot:CAMPEP_0197624002 /NCGR_PEP_ID=MMETSP1338-20131121/3835_1 /TAXON_ID=43686 ORGANISM="Pelagodinium beii, Strain RCC1491" /NCGR_SAMPLE_ID=MMETSP1338 /ASSEMBLY_ACC=CAM_ASM_000754 /LENGTH=386 /DNA_ID=CAMNT_0043194097 /DNA_START=1 /DNA_END=1161 /DNA_ORIENTATION=-